MVVYQIPGFLYLHVWERGASKGHVQYEVVLLVLQAEKAQSQKNQCAPNEEGRREETDVVSLCKNINCTGQTA